MLISHGLSSIEIVYGINIEEEIAQMDEKIEMNCIKLDRVIKNCAVCLQ
jgi:hypothetical protein